MPRQIFEPNAFIAIDPNGDIRLVVTRSEMGQGVRTALAMILAEELDADWSRVKIEQGDCDPKYGDMTTGGSMSIRSTWDPLRKAGAAARDMLLTAAAQTWSVPKDECAPHGGSMIEHKKTGRKIDYGALAAKAAAVPVPKDVPLKDPKDYRIVGTKRARVDGQHIVIGEAHYGIDTKVPGMLYAVVARPPVFGGKVKKFDATPRAGRSGRAESFRSSCRGNAAALRRRAQARFRPPTLFVGWCGRRRRFHLAGHCRPSRAHDRLGQRSRRGRIHRKTARDA